MKTKIKEILKKPIYILNKLIKKLIDIWNKQICILKIKINNGRVSFAKLFYLNDKNSYLNKIKLANNKPLTDAEFSKVEKICDIFIALSHSKSTNVTPPDGGLFWSAAKKENWCFNLYNRKSRREIDHSFLFHNRFRDFPSIAYESDIHTTRADFWVRRYIRLQNAMPKKWRVKIPARFGEIGWNVKGYPVNRLTSINQERLSALYLSGVIRYLEKQSNPKIMEIGAGSGELGYVLCKALPKSTWYDCDLLGSLFYSAIHMLVLLPMKKHLIYVGDLDLPENIDESYIIRSAAEAAQLKDAIVSIPNFLIQDFVGHLQLHLAYNTYSFAEMPRSAVEEYADVLGNLLQDHGVLFEQNGYFPTECGHSVVDILSQKLTIQKWFANYPDIEQRYLKYILNGEIRLWSNNSITNNLHAGLLSLKTELIFDSLLNKDDVEDLKFSPEMWGDLWDMFPESIE